MVSLHATPCLRAPIGSVPRSQCPRARRANPSTPPRPSVRRLAPPPPPKRQDALKKLFPWLADFDNLIDSAEDWMINQVQQLGGKARPGGGDG